MVITDLHIQVFEGKICPYCNQPPVYTDSAEVYGKSFGMIYLCRTCDAYVGVHKGTDKPLGRLANKELREAKKQAHLFFDKIWQLNVMTRTQAYECMGRTLQIPREFCHIGMLSVKSCREVVLMAKQVLNDNRRLDLDLGAEPVTPYYES